MDRRKEFLIRVYIVMGVFTLVAGILICKAFIINVMEGEIWRKKSRELYFNVMDIKAERGKILADDGSPLATSQPIFEIRMDTKAAGLTQALFNKNVDSLAFCISTHLYPGKSKNEVKNQLTQARARSDRYAFIAKNLNYDQLQLLKSFPLFRLGANKGGMITITENRREKPYKNFASRTVGLDRENAEPIGLEKSFDAYLKGREGHRVMRKVGANVYIPVNGLEEIVAKKGSDIITTINPGIQEIAELTLAESITKHQAEEGCAIVMEVATGAIKAIANLSWNENQELIETYNFAIAKSSEPGSTFKLASLLAMLEDGKIDTTTAVDLNGGACKFYDRIMKDSKLHGIGMSDLSYSFIQSSNVGISKLASHVFSSNALKFIEYLQKFGLNQKTGIELEGEPQPMIKHPVKNKNIWYGTTLPWMSVGYELQLTPLQVLTFYNGVANHGRVMKPYLVSDILDGRKIVKHIEPKVLRDSIASDATLLKVKALLKEVVEIGTAKNIKSEVYSIAGKTGTAVSNYFEKGFEKKNYQSSFAGFFPADDPKYSCIVVVYNPQESGFYGGEVAAPVFKKIADRCMRSEFSKVAVINRDPKSILGSEALPIGNKGFALDFEKVFKHIGLPITNLESSKWISTIAGEDGVYSRSWEFNSQRMPDLIGMGLRDAMYIMDIYGVQLIPHGKGKIRSQSISPGSAIQNRVIELYLE
ncbi:MAG: transpeptidase family protein [Saprospiraceae bacterium]|nr:transpeptidase family protein [Saprospiraceae bacterium]